MMKLDIAGGGSMEITDDNKTIVSADIMKEVEYNFQTPDNTDITKPDITLKD